MKRKAFTLTELLVSMVVMLIIAGVYTLTPNIGRQSARREAEKLYSYLSRIIDKSNHNHTGFTIQFVLGKTLLKWDGNSNYEIVPINKGFTLSANNNNSDLIYSYVDNSFKPPSRTLTIERDDGDKCEIDIYVPGGTMNIK